MARVELHSPDLLFGSKVEGALRAAGHEVRPVAEPAGAAGMELLVIDLTTDAERRLEGLPEGVPTLAFYSHVEQDVRAAADAAGVTRVVPRSRMAREGAALAEGLLA